MTKEEFLQFHKEMCQRMIETTALKNSDYTAGDDDPFANFTTVERLDIVNTEIGFLVRMTDKFMRIRSFMKKGVLLVKDESVIDTLIDLANYCLSLAAFIESKRRKELKK